MELINKYLSGGILPIVLALYAIAFIVYLRGRPFSNPRKMIAGLFKKKEEQGVSPLRAVIFALAGTLGVGNIVGVSSAIALGGAGAVFWMWCSALLAMILKYCEVVLAVKHRRVRNGELYGGAMYYMRDHFYASGKYGRGILFCLIFTVFCLCNGATMGCMIQSNAIAISFNSTFGMGRSAVGFILSILCVIVFIFNGKRLFSLCERLVPLVSLIYMLMSLAVILFHIDRLPTVINMIFTDAFSVESVGAGAFGFLISRSLRYGTVRGLFSNEAGCGTSPIAHATANTSSPSEQGVFGIIEVFIDTIIVCTMTAFVILGSKEGILSESDPMLTVITSFESVLGRFGEILLSICIFMFAFATVICWGYYGKECIYFLSKSKKAERYYYIAYSILVLFGSFVSLDGVWQLADLAVGVMTVMNLYILGQMRREVRKETELYFKKRAPRRKL